MEIQERRCRVVVVIHKAQQRETKQSGAESCAFALRRGGSGGASLVAAGSSMM
jgi:hypothetical protein